MKPDKDKVIKTLYEELKRKDEQIEKLKEENKLLMKTAMKRAEKLKELEEKVGNK
ncbi:hypothetical protein JXC34_00940 [Candidatus Woesearchaeota archaeon]|nr:hypothetical protein [Candidatus Woesearchaeota archaeon]